MPIACYDFHDYHPVTVHSGREGGSTMAALMHVSIRGTSAHAHDVT